MRAIDRAFSAPRAAYIHVPFCVHRCGYCNFTLIAGRNDLIDRYLEALAIELGWLDHPREVDTLFLGGGTPTHLPPHALERLLRIVLASFRLAAGNEFSVEANPADLDAERVRVLADHGVNRVSLGAQSFSAEKLRMLERDHVPDDIVRTIELVRSRVPSVSLDLIFGVPGESLSVWEGDLERALALAPNHISTYGLTFERGTTFWSRRQRGELHAADEELERKLYATGIDRLIAAGFEHYEVSNFARPSYRCRHNEVYWAGEGYYAAGPGAARYVEGRREINHRSTTTYLRRVLSGQSPVAESETLAPTDRAREALVLGLRRMSGVDRDEFKHRIGMDVDELVGPALQRHVGLGLLADDGRRIRLTREGLFVSDAIWPAFLRC